jgi:DNA-binding LytR/AlgR family response regulator
MNCIICADRNSSGILEEYVKKYSSLKYDGTFTEADTIREQLSKKEDIGLVLLDIEIPEFDIFNFLGTLNNKPNIIIISSGDQYALKAYDFNVVDYLLKPVTYSRFCKAVDKAIKYYSPNESDNIISNEVFIKKGSSLIKLNLKEIVFIEALENYITLNTSDDKYTIHFTMKAIENQLLAGIFIRVHRSFIVNRSMIKSIKENSLDLLIGDKLKNIPIGNSYRDSLLNSINMVAK